MELLRCNTIAFQEHACICINVRHRERLPPAKGVNTHFLEKLADAPGSPFQTLGLAEHGQIGNFPKRQAKQQVFLRKLKFDPHIGLIEPQVWSTLFTCPNAPLWIDLGCGSGRCLLALAHQQQQHLQEQPQHQHTAVNYLGIDVKQAFMERANEWAQLLGISNRVHYLFGNATISLGHLLSNYPGPVQLVAVQFPDPEVRRHLIMQPELAQDIAAVLQPGGGLVVQSDVQDVALHINDVLLETVREQFALADEHFSVQKTVTPDGNDDDVDKGNQGQQGQEAEQDVADEQRGIGWSLPSGVADLPSLDVSYPAGDASCLMPWLQHDPDAAAAIQHHSDQIQQQEGRAPRWLYSTPLGMPTERELYVRRGRRPIWRFMLIRK